MCDTAHRTCVTRPCKVRRNPGVTPLTGTGPLHEVERIARCIPQTHATVPGHSAHAQGTTASPGEVRAPAARAGSARRIPRDTHQPAGRDVPHRRPGGGWRGARFRTAASVRAVVAAHPGDHGLGQGRTAPEYGE